MKKQCAVKVLLVTLTAGSGILLSGCNSGGSAASVGSQNTTAKAISKAQASASLVTSNSCLTATATFPSESSPWYYKGNGVSIVVKNSCPTSQDLSRITFSLMSQDIDGNDISLSGTGIFVFLNGDIGSLYNINFTGSGATQTGRITGNLFQDPPTPPTILANSMIKFDSYGWVLKGVTYNSALAESSFIMNVGGVVTQ